MINDHGKCTSCEQLVQVPDSIFEAQHSGHLVMEYNDDGDDGDGDDDDDDDDDDVNDDDDNNDYDDKTSLIPNINACKD